MGQNNFSTEHIWVAIPVFNNKDTVKGIVDECRRICQNVVVVDDGSTDTDISALFSGAGITVLKHKTNQGKGSALRTALNYIESQGGRFMVTIDADGQHHPRDIEKFVPLLQDDEAIIVIGCRIFPRAGVPARSRFGRKLANFWLRLETGESIADAQSGFRAYPVRYLSRMNLNGAYYDFETEVLAKAVWAGLRLKTVEVDVWYPPASERVSGFRPFVDNLRISRMHARLAGRRLIPFPYRRLVAKRRLKWNLFLSPVGLLRELLKENAAPAGLAAAAAAGVFLGALPLIAVHTLVIIYVAKCLHLNKIMALSAQHLCIPPFMPVVCIELGYYIRYGRWLTDISPRVIFAQWPQRLFEWLLGAVVFGPVAAAIVGLVVFFTARGLQGARRVQGARGAQKRIFLQKGKNSAED